MAASYLTLAALATAAVAELEVTGAEPYPLESGDYVSALLRDQHNERWLVRAPLNPAAEARQSAELVALSALTSGVRRRLPFAVQRYAGQAPMGDTRIVVLDYLDGHRIGMADIRPAQTLTISIGHSIAAIHSLPVSVVIDAGLPTLTASECLRASVALVDRAEGSGRIPQALLDRWDKVITHSELWQFQPTVIHGGLGADSLLVDHDTVSGVLDWGQLRIGDPATDLHWLLAGTLPAVGETAFDAYAIARQQPVDRAFRLRSRFYAELELARWLLHGVDTDDESIIDDAVSMMDALLAQVAAEEPLVTGDGRSPMGLEEVRAMLSREHPSIYSPAQSGRALSGDE